MVSALCLLATLSPVAVRANPALLPKIGMLWSPHRGEGTLIDKAWMYRLALVGPDTIGMRWSRGAHADMATTFESASLPEARRFIARYQRENPAGKLLVENYFFEANQGAYPDDSPWWKRDANGKRITFWPGCFDMRTDHPDYVAHIARRIAAVDKATRFKTGLYLDNLRFDASAKKGWNMLLGKLRAQRPNRFIMANAGWASDDLAWIAPKINGVMYEDSINHTQDGNKERFYARVARFDRMMRKPTLSIVEVFGKAGDDVTAMREFVRTLVYTDAAYLYADSTNGHFHDWRPEWSYQIGPATDPPRTPNGQVQWRRYKFGIVVWNPTARAESVRLPGAYGDFPSGRADRIIDLPAQTGVILKRAAAG